MKSKKFKINNPSPFKHGLLALAGSIFSLGLHAQAPEQSFTEWLTQLRTEASTAGVSAEILDLAFAQVHSPLERVLELDKSQPEFTLTFSGYMKNRMNDARIRRGRKLLQEHKELFDKLETQYGIQRHYLVSFWALESNFGDYTGGFSVINALATLAWDTRRSSFFRGELLKALNILEEGHIAPDRMTGSWAGAMGQCQFMPSTFAAYARDGDGDGHIDIWNSVPDVMTSAANYLSQVGWHRGQRWGREVLLPENFDFTLSGLQTQRSVTQWQSLGVRKIDASPLGSDDMQGSVILPVGANGPAFLVYNNFRTIMIWNRSQFYAIAVGHLADRFTGAAAIKRMPQNEVALSRADVIELQELLNSQGFPAGYPDGILGSKTREALRDFQAQRQLPTDAYASYEMLEILRVSAESQ